MRAISASAPVLACQAKITPRRAGQRDRLDSGFQRLPLGHDFATAARNGGNSRRGGAVVVGVTADVVFTVVRAASMQAAYPAACPTLPAAQAACTAAQGGCTAPPATVTGTDPLLVARRHVDFLRIRSAI